MDGNVDLLPSLSRGLEGLMRVKTLSLPFGKINANRIYWEVGIAPVLCRQAFAHVPAVS